MCALYGSTGAFIEYTVHMQDGFVAFSANLFTVSFGPYGSVRQWWQLDSVVEIQYWMLDEGKMFSEQWSMEYRGKNAQKSGAALLNRVYNRGCTPVCAVPLVQ